MVLKNKLQEIKNDAARMELFFCDNRELLHYFRTLQLNVELIERLCEQENKFNYLEMDYLIEDLLKKDESLTDVTVNYRIKPIILERKEARITAKMF